MNTHMNNTNNYFPNQLVFPVSAWRKSLGMGFIQNGDNSSGQQFRAEVAYPLYKQAKKINANLLFDFSGIIGGCTAWFIREGIGGLYWRDRFDLNDISSRIKFTGFDEVMLSNIKSSAFSEYEEIVSEKTKSNRISAISSEDVLEYLKSVPEYKLFDPFLSLTS